MPFRYQLVAPVFFVRWEGTTEAHDFDDLVKQISKARVACDRKLVYVAIISASNALPEAAARSRIASALDEVWEYCSSIHVVIEGSGMRRALVRSVIAGLLLVVMKRSRRFGVHVSVEEAFAEATKIEPLDVADVLARARRTGGLLEPESRDGTTS